MDSVGLLNILIVERSFSCTPAQAGLTWKDVTCSKKKVCGENLSIHVETLTLQQLHGDIQPLHFNIKISKLSTGKSNKAKAKYLIMAELSRQTEQDSNTSKTDLQVL